MSCLDEEKRPCERPCPFPKPSRCTNIFKEPCMNIVHASLYPPELGGESCYGFMPCGK